MALADKLVQVNKLKLELDELLPMSIESERTFWKKIRLDWNFNSNHIEGNTLTYGETQLLLIFDKTTGDHELREYEEMKAHDVAIHMVKEWAKDKSRDLNEIDIRELNKTILVQAYWKDAITSDGQSTRRQIKVGEYKDHPNSVRLKNGEIFEYTSPLETPQKMNDLMAWYRNNDIQHPLVLASQLHYDFIRIHPFDDGNGRVARLLVNYVLMRNDYPPIIVKSAEKEKYLTALNKADVGDLNAFHEYMAEQLIWSLEIALKAVKNEDIEEENDIEKEISVWKKHALQNKVEALHRTDKLVHDLYFNGIKEMFEQFEQKHKQFYDMFQKTTSYSYKNSNSSGGIDWLTNEILKIKNNIQVPKFKIFPEDAEPTEPDNFTQIFIKIDLKEYKYNEQNPFSLYSQLTIDLMPYKYSIKYNNDLLAEKNYNQSLTPDETKKIIADSIKNIFLEIKSKSGK